MGMHNRNADLHALRIVTDDEEPVSLLPRHSRSSGGNSVSQLYASASFGKLDVLQAQDDTFRIWRWTVMAVRDTILTISHPYQSYTGIIFGVKNHVRMELPNIDLRALKTNEYNLLYLPTLNVKTQLKANTEYSIAGIAISRPFLMKSAEEYLSSLTSYIDRINSHRAALLFQHNLFFTAHTASIKHELLDRLSNGMLTSLFLRARTLCMLEAMFDFVKTKQFRSLENDIAEAERETVHQVVHYLVSHLDQHISLSRVSAMFKIQERRLGRFFKMLYGTDLSRFVLERRMQHAQRLLLSGKSVKEVAYATGYGSPSNFSLIFKKSFGCSPRDVLRTLTIIKKESELLSF